MRRTAALALLVALGAAGLTPIGAAGGLRLRLDATEGWPRDPAERAAFGDAFDSTLAAACPGEMAACPVSIDTSSHADSVWHVSVVVGLPAELPGKRTRYVRVPGSKKVRRQILLAAPGQRATRGLTVVVAISSPEAHAAGARPLPVRSGIQFSGERYDPYPFADAGRVAAQLALEALFRTAAPRADARFDLAPARRVDDSR